MYRVESIGGSITKTVGGVLGDDYDVDDEMPELSEKEDVKIVVPE